MSRAISTYLPLLTPPRIGAELRKTWECEQAAEVFDNLAGFEVFDSLDPALQTSPKTCTAFRRMAESGRPRDLVFAAVAGLMVGSSLMREADEEDG